MLMFIGLSLALCYVEEKVAAVRTLLVSPVFFYVGLVIALLSIAGLLLKKLPEIWCYDSFSSGTLILWYAEWKTLPLFNFGTSPIFFFFPLFFALMSAFITLFLSNQNHRIDKESLHYMQYLEDERLMPPWSLMICVLISLALEQHYTLYPVLMTLLMLRLAFSSFLTANQ